MRIAYRLHMVRVFHAMHRDHRQACCVTVVRVGSVKCWGSISTAHQCAAWVYADTSGVTQ